ncbi:hypothetical protein D8674_000979 [Pyrus ussuriensis x Pyrus communis]|uniref:Uncharacterized protein n=1 Tax=Pyrus ussuriensis x Pyrus communis TaxID=2448454 RepID=A0A5N5F4R7_9ROSA|nr:hypothetical protein D8674_000979 [Pyrus ussuriensis x Pyrus communis]
MSSSEILPLFHFNTKIGDFGLKTEGKEKRRRKRAVEGEEGWDDKGEEGSSGRD